MTKNNPLSPFFRFAFLAIFAAFSCVSVSSSLGQDRGRGGWGSQGNEGRRDFGNRGESRDRDLNRRGDDGRGRNDRGGGDRQGGGGDWQRGGGDRQGGGGDWQRGGGDWQRGGGDWQRGGGDRQGGDDRGGWNPMDFIERLDTNGNGRLEPSEMSGRAERYIQSLGFDTSNSIPIAQIMGRVEGGSNQRSQSRGEPARKVPGFGAVNDPVPNFGAISDEQLNRMFSPDIIRRVNETMDRYDRNGDGILDEQEVEGVNWGSPPFQQSDLDGDGKISRLELAFRYRAREAIREDNSERRRSSREERDTIDREDRGMFSAEPASASGLSRTRRNSSRDRVESRTSSSSGSTRDRGSSSGSDDNLRSQTENWVDSMMEEYDKDGDGKLSNEEIEAMRNPPARHPSGFITRDQFVEYLLNDRKWPEEASSEKDSNRSSESASNRVSTSGASTDQGRTTSRFARNNRTSNDRGNDRRDTGRNSQAPKKTTFEDFDVNGNGKIEMHEFSDQWSDEVLEEFYQIDTNRDGVITRREWQAAGRR